MSGSPRQIFRLHQRPAFGPVGGHMRIRAFQGLIPRTDLAAKLASPPYDVLDTAEARAVAVEAELKRVLRDLSRAAPLSEAGSADSVRGAPARHPSSESHSSLRVQIPPLPQVRACDAPPSADSGSDADNAVSPHNIPARVPSEEHTPRSILACMRSAR